MILLLLLLHLGQGLSSQAIPLSLLGVNDTVISLRDASPSCTCPDPDQRSVWDIVWSCLVVVFACSWVSVHPDIPAPGEGWKRSTLRRLEYMLWTLLTPELMILWALKQFLGARRIAKEQHNKHGWTTVHGHFLQMGGFMLFDGKNAKGVLPYTQFKQLLTQGRIEFPDITEEEIQDRGKSNGLGKTLVIAHTGWFILQCISRRAQGLDLTEIELATLAFAALNGCMYFFWWDKPFDVHVPVPVRLLPTATLDMSLAQVDGDPKPDENQTPNTQEDPPHNWPPNIVGFIGHRLYVLVIPSPTEALRFEHHDTVTSPEAAAYMRVPIFNSTYATIGDDKAYLLLALIFVGSGFGAIHCAGWSFHFPSTGILWIWRISALLITSIPVILFLLIFLGSVSKDAQDVRSFLTGVLAFAATFISFPMYIVARLVLMVESFATLRDLPPAALAAVKWTSFIPHIS